MVEEHHLAAGAAELLQEQDLIGVVAGQPVRAEHRDDVDLGVADGVAQRVEPGPVEPCAAVALVAGRHARAVSSWPASCAQALKAASWLSIVCWRSCRSVETRA